MVSVEPESLRGHAVALAATRAPTVGLIAIAPAPDAISHAVVEWLNARMAALVRLGDYGGALRQQAAGALTNTGCTLQDTDETQASPPAAPTTTGSPARALSPSATLVARAAAPAPQLGPNPPLPSPPPLLSGATWAALIHAGQGTAGLYRFAHAAKTQARRGYELAEKVDALRAPIDTARGDTHQQAGQRLGAHARWMYEHAERLHDVAEAATSIAACFDALKTTTPTPELFDRLLHQLVQASTPSHKAALTAEYAALQNRIIDAAHTYHTDTSAILDTLNSPLCHPPAITHRASPQTRQRAD